MKENPKKQTMSLVNRFIVDNTNPQDGCLVRDKNSGEAIAAFEPSYAWLANKFVSWVNNGAEHTPSAQSKQYTDTPRSYDRESSLKGRYNK